MQKENTKTTFLEEIFYKTIHLGLCKNQLDFSKNIVGKNEKWLSVVRAESREPSIGALLNMAMRLDKIATNESGYKNKKNIRDIHHQVMQKLASRTSTNDA